MINAQKRDNAKGDYQTKSRFSRLGYAAIIAPVFLFAATLTEANIPSKKIQTIIPTAIEDTVSSTMNNRFTAEAKTKTAPTTPKTENKPTTDNKLEKQNTLKKARKLCNPEKLETQEQLDNYVIFSCIISRLNNYLGDGRLNEEDFSISISTDKKGTTWITVVLNEPISISLNQEFFGTWSYCPKTGELKDSAVPNNEEDKRDKRPQRDRKDQEEDQWPVDA